MDQRTYELIAQLITDKSGVRVELLQGVHPHAIPNEKIIRLPLDIEDSSVFAALAVTMHEAAHIQYTTFDAEAVTGGCSEKFEILNSAEDVRIDSKNYRVLPNVRDFYEHLYKVTGEKGDATFRQAPLPLRVLCRLIMRGAGMAKMLRYRDPEAAELIRKTTVEADFFNLVHLLDGYEREKNKPGGQYKTLVKECIDKIYAILYPGKPPQQNMPKQQQQPGQGQPLQQSRIDKLIKKGYDEIFKQSKQASKGKGSVLVSPIQLEEQTKARFSELMNEKCVKQILDGERLDTGNLLSYYTGDIEALFVEEKTITRKKSKVLLVLDASGSMCSQLIDGNERKRTVLRAAKALDEILMDICRQEGANVSYEIAAFDDAFVKLNRNNIDAEYYARNGGTDIINAFMNGSAVLNQPDVDGEKLMVFITDGEVGDGEIDTMRSMIISQGSNIKCVLIGVGAGINSPFVTKVIGSNNILAEKHSNTVLMEAIMQVL